MRTASRVTANRSTCPETAIGALPTQAMRPTIGTSARLPGGKHFGKALVIENGEGLARHLHLFGG